MSKKHRVAKKLFISHRNCAVLEYLDGNYSDLTNEALEYYFKHKLKLSREQTDTACARYMHKHFQQPLFSPAGLEPAGIPGNGRNLCFPEIVQYMADSSPAAEHRKG